MCNGFCPSTAYGSLKKHPKTRPEDDPTKICVAQGLRDIDNDPLATKLRKGAAAQGLDLEAGTGNILLRLLLFFMSLFFLLGVFSQSRLEKECTLFSHGLNGSKYKGHVPLLDPCFYSTYPSEKRRVGLF